VIVTHGYELIARSHEEWAWPPHGSSSVEQAGRCEANECQSDCLLPPFSGLRTRLNETQGREQTFEGEQYREVISQARLSER